MKQGIHPKYYPKAKIKCACGAEFTVGSTQKLTEVEICSNCHPLYTGKQKFIDTAGRLERYEKMLAKSSALKKNIKDKTKKNKTK
ncbi:50S ribosomal protein L31 [Patescibacteria group bacterium]|nr:50S ribosomal protein L31 [Patescibacteria group bacterium]